MDQHIVHELAHAAPLLHKHGSAGIDAHGDLCWTFDRKQLQLWSSSNTSQLPLIKHLPYPVSSAVIVAAARYQVSDQRLHCT